MLEIRLQSRQYERKALRSIHRLLQQLVRRPFETVVDDRDKRLVLAPRNERPLHAGSPIDDDAAVLLNGKDVDIRPYAIHLPIPAHFGAAFQLAAAFREPELGRHLGIDESPKHLLHRSANQHLRANDGRLTKRIRHAASSLDKTRI
jgi:hypothetical protein